MPSDIGIVIYTKGLDTQLNAKWHSVEDGISFYGTGVAIRENANGGEANDNTAYEGEYIVRYFLSDGTSIGDFDLKITKQNNGFQVTWKKDGELKYFGVGLEYENSLSVSWRKP